MLVVLYSAIGYYLARTQIANRRPLGGWSLSGLALTIVFPTCAVMHGIYAYYSLTGRYACDVHGLGIDCFAVPAAVYFLWVVHGSVPRHLPRLERRLRGWRSRSARLRRTAPRPARPRRAAPRPEPQDCSSH